MVSSSSAAVLAAPASEGGRGNRGSDRAGARRAAIVAAAPQQPLRLVLQFGVHERVLRMMVSGVKQPVTKDLEAALREALRRPREWLARGSEGRRRLEALLGRWQAAGEWDELPLRLVAVWEAGDSAVQPQSQHRLLRSNLRVR